MARIASQSKGGFYATPISQLELLCNKLKFISAGDGTHLVNLIDPCCGEGEALRFIADHLHGAQAATYGVELEESRYLTAQTVLDHVIHDGYENLRTESKFGVLWLNPVYDDGFSERLEVTFLRALTGKSNVLEKDGILFFCIPQYVLKAAAGILSGRFRYIRVFRFTDDAYDVFKQVVVIAKYGKAKGEESKKNYKFLKEAGEQGPDALQTLAEIDEDIVVQSSAEPVDFFRAGRMQPEELNRDFASSPLFEEVAKRLIPISGKATMKNPLLPLKPTHTGIAIASGAVGGNMGTHIIAGVTKQITDVEERHNEEGRKTAEVITKHFKSIVRVYCRQGIYDLE